jgi:hypothetical protein
MSEDPGFDIFHQRCRERLIIGIAGTLSKGSSQILSELGCYILANSPFCVPVLLTCPGLWVILLIIYIRTQISKS